MNIIRRSSVPTSEMVFYVPPGIGDITWCYQKIYPLLAERRVAFQICNDQPPRSLDFVSRLPGIDCLGYGQKGYHMTQRRLLQPTTDLATLSNGLHYIALNPWLERGARIETLFPKQNTQFHFPIVYTIEEQEEAMRIRRWAGGAPLIGFYCSSYQHRPEFGFWSVQEWCRFLLAVNFSVPNAKFVALGAPYDNKTIEVTRNLVLVDQPVISAVGFNIGATFALLSELDYFFAFPSGLGILGDVVNTPTMMWYWSNVQNPNFLDCYADPVNVASKFHINQTYGGVQESLDVFRKWGLQYLDENFRFDHGANDSAKQFARSKGALL